MGWAACLISLVLLFEMVWIVVIMSPYGYDNIGVLVGGFNVGVCLLEFFVALYMFI